MSSVTSLSSEGSTFDTVSASANSATTTGDDSFGDAGGDTGSSESSCDSVDSSSDGTSCSSDSVECCAGQRKRCNTGKGDTGKQNSTTHKEDTTTGSDAGDVPSADDKYGAVGVEFETRFAYSRPCGDCVRAMQAVGIGRVFYSDRNGDVVVERVDDMVGSLSSGRRALSRSKASVA